MNERRRDPNSRAFWFGIAALTVLCVPYPFAGTAEPVVLDLPFWFLVSIGAAIGLVTATIYAIARHWHLAPDEDTDD